MGRMSCKFLIIMMSFTAVLLGSEITTLTFSKSDLYFTKHSGYDLICLRNGIFDIEIGKPQLPVRHIRILIPPDSKVEEVEIVSVRKNDLDGEYNIFPAQLPTPIGGEPVWAEPVPEVYNSSKPYPEEIVRFAGEGYMAGNKLASILIYPLQYKPKEKKLTLFTEMTIKIKYAPDINRGISPKRMTPETQRMIEQTIKNMVVNPQDFDLYSPRPMLMSSSQVSKFAPTEFPSLMGSPVSYVIITGGDDGLVSEFQTLADWKTRKGVPAVVRTLPWIRVHYNGNDDQECTRNFIRDAYINWGITWVLIGGDVNIVPVRYAAVGIVDVPTDLYYSCLDGDWNANKDARFGEATFDNTDLYPEVFVGRVPTRKAEEANAFVSKIIDYEKSPTYGYVTKMLFLGEKMGYYDSDGKDLCDSLADYYVPNYFVKRKLYEIENTENREAVIDSLNAGFGLIYSQGHGHTQQICVGKARDRLLPEDFDNLTNGNRQSIWFGVSCRINEFDHDCISEHFINNSEGGGVAFIANALFDFPFPNFGFDKSFFDYLFNTNHYRIGEILSLSKIAYIVHSQKNNPYRGAQFGRNLLGDPEMPVWTDEPKFFDVVHPHQIRVGADSFTVEVRSPWVGMQSLSSDSFPPGSPIPGALVCIKKDNEDYGYGYTGSDGRITFYFTPESEGQIIVIVTRRNRIPYEGSCSVVAPEPYVCYYSHQIQDGSGGNGNSVPDAGEEIRMPLSLKNTGAGTAYDVEAVLSCADSYITIIDSTEDFGDIPSGQSRQSLDAFRFKIDKGCPDQHRIIFDLEISSSLESYADTFQMIGFAPELIHSGHEIHGLMYNMEIANSGRRDSLPERTEELSMTVRSGGFGQADGVKAYLFCDDPGIEIIDNEIEFGSIPGRSEKKNLGTGFLFRRNTVSVYLYFAVEIVDSYGRVWSDTFEVNNRPDTVSFSRAWPGRNSIELIWYPSGEPDLLGYNIYRGTVPGGPYTKVNPVPIENGSYFHDSGLERATRYYYRVTVVDSSRNESYFSHCEELVAETNPQDLSGWPKEMERGGFAGVVACDLDPSYPGLELIAEDVAGTIYCWHCDGTGYLSPDGVFARTGYESWGSPAVGDIDLDGNLEVVVSQMVFGIMRNPPTPDSTIVIVYDNTGEELWRQGLLKRTLSTPVIAPLDPDPYLEILAVTMNGPNTTNGMIYCFNHDGSLNWAAICSSYTYASPVVGDLEPDGGLEIGLGIDGGGHIWSGSGEEIYSTYRDSARTDPNFLSGVLGDIVPDSAGIEGAVIGLGTRDRLFMGDMEYQDGEWHPRGYQGFPVWMEINELFASPALGDLDGDGDLEIVVGAEDGVYAVKPDSTILPGFPAFRRRQSSSSPAIGDIDGDGDLEILIGSGVEEDRLYAYHHDGTMVLGFPIKAELDIHSSPLLTDLDLDGDLEVAFASSDRKVYVFDLPAPYNPANIAWPGYRHDPWRTGNYETPLDLSGFPLYAVREPGRPVPLKYSLYQNCPNPCRGQTHIRFQVPGPTRVSLKLYDVSGRLVRVLIDSKTSPLEPGTYELLWDGRDDRGMRLASGVYFYRLEAEDFNATRKLVLIR